MPYQPVLDGMSIVPLFTDMMTERAKPMGFMLRLPGGVRGPLNRLDFVRDTCGVWIDGKYKLSVNLPDGDQSQITVELYDIFADAAEKNNLASENPEIRPTDAA